MLENLVLHEDDKVGCRGGWERDYSYKSLQKLDLSRNNISDDDMPSIILLLRRLTGLQVLSLDQNTISDRGLALLAQDRVPSRLRQIHLSDNRITHESCESVIDILETHPELSVFTTGVQWSCSPSKSANSKHGNGDGASILNLLDMNLAGRVLLQQPEGLRPPPLAAWSYVLYRVNCSSRETFFLDSNFWKIPFNRKNSMFVLLRHGQVLFASRQLANDGRYEEASTALAQAANSKRKYDASN